MIERWNIRGCCHNWSHLIIIRITECCQTSFWINRIVRKKVYKSMGSRMMIRIAMNVTQIIMRSWCRSKMCSKIISLSFLALRVRILVIFIFVMSILKTSKFKNSFSNRKTFTTGTNPLSQVFPNYLSKLKYLNLYIPTNKASILKWTH